MNKKTKKIKKFVGFSDRFIAYAIDSVVLLIPILGIALQIFYYFRDSQTIGYKAIGAKIYKIKDNNITEATKGQLILRFFGKILSSMLLYLGFLWIYRDKRQQGMHDHIAQTVVIREGKKYLGLALSAFLFRLILIIGVPLAIFYSIFSYMKPSTTERSTQINTITINQDIQYDIIKITDGLQVPRAMAFTDTDRILVTERAGRIRVIQNNILQESPLYTVPFISNTSEEGLMSIVLDPNYIENKRLYISYAYTDGESMRVRVVRFTDQGDTLTDETLIIDQLPAAQRHAGTALAFGPDGMLYITVGDATQSERAQFVDFYNGKILRIFPDGTIPQDNIHPDYATRVMGLRNSQGIAWNSNGDMYAIDHGPSIFDGPPGGDEINHITAKGNYGRPILSHEKSQDGMIDPIAIYTPAIAPASLMVYQGTMFPERQDHLFIGMLRGEGILKVEINPNNPTQVIDQQKIVDNNYGRIRHVTQGPDGSIYFSTSNEDGRGKRQPGGDAIYQIIRK